MLAFLEGELVQRSGNTVVLQCGAFGFRIEVPGSTLQKLPELGAQVRLWTVVELYQEPGGRGEVRLYGFATEKESQVFELLRSVSGIGTRTALGILSAVSVAELRQAVLSGDTALLQRLPGIGRKTAERLVVELRDRMLQLEVEEGGLPSSVYREVVAALVALGYTRGEAEAVLRQLVQEWDGEISVEALLKRALQRIQR
ncbi:Holliday junction ATP-dependent DNA helicase RuvA [bacterium HR21]|jgi:Holliday junction DNA helicase RuvA|nr:Holliday junction ATP-dependent DNA helicase RuvA [bacterium HR21]